MANGNQKWDSPEEGEWAHFPHWESLQSPHLPPARPPGSPQLRLRPAPSQGVPPHLHDALPGMTQVLCEMVPPSPSVKS